MVTQVILVVSAYRQIQEAFVRATAGMQGTVGWPGELRVIWNQYSLAYSVL